MMLRPLRLKLKQNVLVYNVNTVITFTMHKFKTSKAEIVQLDTPNPSIWAGYATESVHFTEKITKR